MKGQTRLINFTFTFHFHALEKEMAAHSSVLPGGSQGQRSLVGCRLWGRTEPDTTEAMQQQQLNVCQAGALHVTPVTWLNPAPTPQHCRYHPPQLETREVRREVSGCPGTCVSSQSSRQPHQVPCDVTPTSCGRPLKQALLSNSLRLHS